jgi:hypothetical protein
MTMISFRADSAMEALLASLAADGETRTDTIRRALQDADHLRRREFMRADALACAADHEDLTEAAAVNADLEPVRAW